MAKPGQAHQTELLEQRSLLTALIINDGNADAFTDALGTLSVTNADLGSHDELIIEDLVLSSTSEGISIDLAGVSLERLAIETVTVESFSNVGIDINLTDVTDTRTISIEDVVANSDAAGLGIELQNTDVYALTVEDSSLSGLEIHVNGTSDVTHGLVTENSIVAPANTAAIELNVNDGATADNFRIINNTEVTALNRDAIRVNLTDSATDGLVIDNNVVGNEPGADVSFRAEGDTFVQPFELTNNATDGELLQSFTLDLRPLGLVFDTNPATGRPFTPVNDAGGQDTGALTGAASVLTNNNQVLTVNFSDFQPGETLLFLIDVDLEPLVPGDPPRDFTTFGRDLIGAAVEFQFGPGANSGAKDVAGTMIGDADVFNASQFVRGAEVSSNFHGVNLNLTNSPLTNASVSSNTVIGVAGNGILVDADAQSDVSAVIQSNTVNSSGQDGIKLALLDSNFTGAIMDNTIGGNTGHGINIQPEVSRSGPIESVVDANPVIITSTNHQLLTGDEIIIQGMVNDDPTVNHPGNGRHTVTRIDNNRFSLQGVDGRPSNVVWGGGGNWYMPMLQGDGSARGLVQIDLQAEEPQGRIQNIQTISGAAQVTSLNHGLTTGDRIRISGAAGTGIGSTQSFKVTVLDDNNFTLDGLASVGPYDTSGGLATWTTNIVEDATDSGDVMITSSNHGLTTGDVIRMVGMTITVDGETLPSSANGRYVITKLTDDTFQLQGATANGVYTDGSGYWVPIEEEAFDGSDIAQAISGNSIDGNGGAGIWVNLTTGTQFNGDIVNNSVIANTAKGVHIESQSFGLGENLPLDPNDPNAAPDVRDISFDVNIGTSATDGNDISNNTEAGIVIEALNFATGSFEIRGNTVNANQRDNNANDPYEGDGIVVRLASDQQTTEATAFLSESVIENNQIGVDARGNEGNGLLFTIDDRTKIQDLEINNNFFLNSGLDGFHFERTEDADLNAVIFEGNDATNNTGDGFDLYARNTVEDELDFRIRNSNIDNNGEYGMRINVEADARINVDVAGTSIRQNGAVGNGYNPNDNEGAAGQAGGIGIRGFQQVEINMLLNDVQINDNTGDGFSVDATNFFDSVVVNAEIIDSELNGNSLTGLRSVGAAFGTYTWTRNDFIGNGTDGVRIISNIDTTDFFNRRVGGQDIDVIAMGNNFQLNGDNGAVLGMGVNAVIGNGDPTENFSNDFGGILDEAYGGMSAGTPAGNGEDGLKIVQEAGPYLRSRDRWRVIEADGNIFTNNAGDGVDIGHRTGFAFGNGGSNAGNEAGNALHGDETISDVHVTLSRADISDNGGDGVEYLADNTFRVPPVAGSGQDNVSNPDLSSLTISRSFIKDNQRRGVDILNAGDEDSWVTLFENEIIGNQLSGVYVMNTASNEQLQSGPEDPLHVEYGDSEVIVANPNIELRIQDNVIESNGTSERSSVVPINDSNDARDREVLANPDFHHLYGTVGTTLGGIVVRVGTANNWSRDQIAAPEDELGRSGIDAEIWRNSLDGNFGADVYFDNFVSIVPDQSGGVFTDNQNWGWSRGYRDPLARFDLSFRENTGNSLDVINGFAFLDNYEELFKSRIRNFAPVPNPDGPFSNPARDRNATRTLGFFDRMGNFPTFQSGFDDVGGLDFWSYDGWGTSTWRVESDFETGGFVNTDPTSGLSDFFDEVVLGGGLGEEDYQWDTGVNVPGFIGLTPFSLQRGDIFDVGPGEDPIAPDQLEENDSFAGAHPLVTDPITGEPAPLSGSLLVNSLTTDGNLNIEKKGDRDYYSFIAAGSGALEVLLDATDANGANLEFLIYEVDPTLNTTEVPMIQSANDDPIRSTVTAGSFGLITVTATAGRTYIVEVISNERLNLGAATNGKPFEYGTVRSYDLTINAPTGVVPNRAASAAPVVTEQSSRPGVVARGNVEGENPRLESVTQVTPNPTNSAVDSFTFIFSEDVSGVDKSDFQLTRDGVTLNLADAILDQVNLETYQLSNLSELTAPSGDYELTLVVAGSGIRDIDAGALEVSGAETVTWTTDNSVNFFGDTTDNVPGDGSATDVDGNRSLRAAVNEANSSLGFDIIELDAGTYTLSLDGRFEDMGMTGDLDIRANLLIRGTGATASDTVIDANNIDRVFHVFPGVELTLENLTIQGGEAFDGAGIFVEGTRTVTGEVSNAGGTVRLLQVNLLDNEAYNQGGGIYNLGTLDIDQSSISNNIAGSRGGAIFNHGETNLLNTTVSTNHAVSRGGGIYNEIRSSAVNTTISPVVPISTLTAVNSTIALNTANAAGGGIYDEAGVESTLGNTVVALNDAATGPQLADSIDSQGFNYIGVPDGSQSRASLGLMSNDLLAGDGGVSADPGLGALTNALGNGTYAHFPTAGSLLVDAGNNQIFANAIGVSNETGNLITEQDQIGSQRLIEANADGTFQIDIGATEVFLSQPVAVISATPNPAGANETVNFDGSASTHTLGLANREITTYEWDFDYDGVTFTVDATGPSPTATHAYPATGSYTAALRVTDDLGDTDIATIMIVVSVPNKPVVTGPFMDGTSDSTPTITWTGGAGQFNLLVTNAAGDTVIEESGITDLFYIPTQSLPVGKYTVVVTAVNGSGSTASDQYMFNIVQIALTDPMNFDQEFDTTPEITFNQIPDAVRYHIWLSEIDPATGQGLDILINDANIDASSAAIPGTDLAAWELETPLTEGRYRVWVRAIDANDNPGDWSSGSTFDIVRPMITGPVTDGASTFDSTPTVTWTDIDANQYQVWLTQLNGADVNGNTLTGPQIIVNTVVTGTSFVTPQLGDGTFRVWVRGVDDNGEAGLWSDGYTFRKDLRSGPIKISPIDAVNVTDRTPTFVWEAVEGASRYDLWVNMVGGASQIVRVEDVPHIDGASTISYTHDTLLNSAVYRWWVRAFNDDGQASAWGTSAEFFIPVPVNDSPADGQTLVTTNLPLFEWDGVPEYVSYEIWVNNLDSGQSRVLNVRGIEDTFYQTTEPLENANFRWWVQGTDAEGNKSQWSDPTDFGIDSSIGNAPTGVSPSFPTTDNTPEFSWVGLPNVTDYELLIKNLSLRGQPEVFRQVVTPGTDFFGNLTYELQQNLNPGVYRWWVRGVNADGTPGPYSQPLDFEVLASAEGLNDQSSPMNEMLLASLRPDTSTVTPEAVDNLHSITVHPMAVVAAWHPEETEVTTETVHAVKTTESTVPDVEVEQSIAVDAVMEELSVADWLLTEPTDENSSEVSLAEAPELTASDDQQSPASAATIGLALLGMDGVRRGTRKNKRDDQ